MYYILTPDKLAIPCKNVIEWAMWFENMERRRVAQDTIDNNWVSTVFLGLDHNFRPSGDPILFETMVFTDGESGSMDRYRTWAEAAAGHERIASMLRHELHVAGQCSIAALRAVMATKVAT
jgi:hypothetical protein